MFRFSLVQVDRSIYAVGGCNTVDGNLTSVARYIEKDDEWEDVAELPKALRYLLTVTTYSILCQS